MLRAPSKLQATRRSQRSAVCPSGMPRRCTLLVRAYRDNAPTCPTPPHGKEAIKEIIQKAADATQPNAMFCYQCEQTLNNTGCTSVGVCGKTPEVAGLQDLMVYSLKGLSTLSHAARAAGHEDPALNAFVHSALFSTLTNVNFDDSRMEEFVEETVRTQARLEAAMRAKNIPFPADLNTHPAWLGDMPHPALWNQEQGQLLAARSGMDEEEAAMLSAAELLEVTAKTSITVRQRVLGETLAGLQELVVYGLKGLAAYAHHAEALGARDQGVYAFVQEALSFLDSPPSEDVGAVLTMALRVGEANFTVMKMLSEAHTGKYGHPVPTPVSLRPVPGKCILVTGHDMHDMEVLLQQSEGKGINVYTHGEMLPAHSYPGLKQRYPHLVGNYGGAWYRQKTDFAAFPGSILVTTNCVLEPLSVYRNNIFTANETGVPGVAHVANGPDGPSGSKNFSQVIERAQQLTGFTEKTVEKWAHDKVVTVGFGHNAVLGVAPLVLDAIATGKLSHIFLIGGCDGSEPQRKYYQNLATEMRTDTMVLTLGCGKFRIFDQDFGNLPGTDLPRLLDMGQCNDAYSALVMATELAKALKTDVNGLPLSLDISWFEQKAVAVLLTMLHLGVKRIRLGPRMPAFLTPDAVQVLVDQYLLMPADVAHAQDDLENMMACK